MSASAHNNQEADEASHISGTDDPSASCDKACSSCSVDCASRTSGNAPDPLATLSPHPSAHIKHVIAVVSGKGGVGKSLVTSLLATSLHKAGYQVGVLDADITGPSIPHAFGISGNLSATAEGIVPSETAEGIRVVSTNLVLPAETTPVLWRGTIISNLVRQFFSEVLWGELDFLLIDMPPGTGDVPLTVYQSLPIDGIVIVTAPQDLVGMIVGKAINMAGMMEVPVLGIIENMAYFECPDCKSTHRVFGTSDIEALAKSYDIDLVGQLPLLPGFAAQMDGGRATAMATDALCDFSAGIVAKVAK
jgi:Mrp family chromosome partitioning ATPase